MLLWAEITVAHLVWGVLLVGIAWVLWQQWRANRQSAPSRTRDDPATTSSSENEFSDAGQKSQVLAARVSGDRVLVARPLPAAHHESRQAASESPEEQRAMQLEGLLESTVVRCERQLAALQEALVAAERAAARLEAALAASNHGFPVSQTAASSSLAEQAQDLAHVVHRVEVEQAIDAAQPQQPLVPLRRPAPERRQMAHPQRDPSAPGTIASPLAARDSTSGRPSQRIRQLAADGYTSQQIAELVGTPVGEVELILGLRWEG